MRRHDLHHLTSHHAKPWQAERLWWGISKGTILGAVMGAIAASLGALASIMLRGIHFFLERWGPLSHDEAVALWGRFVLYAIGPGALVGMLCAIGSFFYWRRWHRHHRRRVWGFPVPPEGEVLASTPVIEGTAAVSHVYHHEDGRWEFLHEARDQFIKRSPDGCCRVTMEKIVHRVPELPVVGELRLGHCMIWDARHEEWNEEEKDAPSAPQADDVPVEG